MESSFSRRDFVRAGLGMVASCPFVRIFAAAPGTADSPGARIKVGILSDTHIVEYGDSDAGEFKRPHSTRTFRRALEEFRAARVDAVMIAGDISDDGFDSQLMAVGEAWRKVFPGDCMPDGRKVAKLFIAGNHDWEGWKYGRKGIKAYKTEEEMKKHILSEHLDEMWQAAFGEKFSKILDTEICGYRFIGAHWPFHKDAAAYLKRVAGTLPKDRPFFYFQHPPLSPAAKRPRKGIATVESVLAAYPNAIAITGHTHDSLTDENSIVYSSFTMVNAASLRYIEPPSGRENSGPMRNSGFKQMPKTNTATERQGMVMTVYDDRVVFARRDYAKNLPLGDDWVVDFSDRKRLAVKPRAAAAKPPAFPPDVKARVTEERDGFTRDRAKCRQIGVVFGQAMHSSPERGRVFDYRIEVKIYQGGLMGETYAVRRFMADGFAGPEERMPPEMECVFDAGSLPHECALEFCVRAADCFGNLSAPVSTGIVKLKGTVVKW